MANYIKTMAEKYPDEGVSLISDGDPTVYGDLIFDGTPRTQVELDALWLSVYKNQKKLEINKKTDQIIRDGGFTFDGQVFAATPEDRMNYGHLDQFSAGLPWPMDVATKDDTVYSLTLVNLPAFIGAALTWINTTLQGGNALKAQVNAAVDIAGVDAVVDNR